MNCVKCGRPIPDGEIFCEACASKPLHPAQRETREQPGRHLAKKEARPGPRRSGRVIAALIVMALVTAASLGGALYLYSTLASQRAGLRAQEADLAARADALQQQEQELSSTRTELESAQEALAELRKKISALEEEVRGSESDLSQNQYDLDATLKELESLREERDTLQGEVESLTAQNAELSGKLSTAESDYAALKSKYGTISDKMAWVDAYVVYVENDGTNYYHSYECSSFKKQSFWVYNRKLAENKGYTACPVCGG